MNRRIAIAPLCIAALFAQPVCAAEKVTFLLDWIPAGDSATIYVAVQKGLFAAEGLDVTVQSGRGSSDVITKLATGTADMATGGLAALLQAKAESDVPVTAVYSIYTAQPDAIFTTEGSGIDSLKDLVGKKVATATFSSSNVVWPLLLEANAVDPAKVDVLKVDPGTLAPLLATGKVDAVINWVTGAPAFEGPLGEAGKKLKLINWADHGFDGYGLSVFASDKMLKERPATVKKFLAAFNKAKEMAIAEPSVAAASLKASLPETDLVTAEKQWKAAIPLMVNATQKKDGDGAFEPKLLARTWQWVANSQHLPLDKFDPEKAVDRSLAN
jgi:NitT/TauT family transport system substrate-binding protein